MLSGCIPYMNNNNNKKCSKCGVERPLSEFGRNGKDRNGSPSLRAACKSCESERGSEKYRRNHKPALRCKDISPKLDLKKTAMKLPELCKRVCGNRSSYSEYAIWYQIKDRCFNTNNLSFKSYGGRGITVCDRWSSYDNFIKDMGVRPSEAHSIDRIDVNGNYEPTNCRWATAIEQANNTRANRSVVWKGEKLTVKQVADLEVLPASRLYARLDHGMTIEQAVYLPKGTHLSKL